MPRMTAEDRKWRAENDLKTLREAEEIKANRSRINAVMKIAEKDKQALTRVRQSSRTNKS